MAVITPAIAREGITKQVANQIAALQERKVNVCLIVLSDFDADVLQELGVLVPPQDILQLRQQDAYLSPQAFLSSLSIIGPILQFLKKRQVSVVVANAPYAHFIMRLVKLFGFTTGLRLALHQYYHGLQYAQFPLNSFPRITINSLNQGLARLADNSHISISKATRTDVEAHFMKHHRHVVLYNPIFNLAKVPTEKVSVFVGKEEAFKIVLPGRLDCNKGQLFFLEVLERFLKRKRIKAGNLQLLLIGAGEAEEEIKARIRNNSLNAFVRLTGAVSNPHLRCMLEKADLVVVPSFVEGLSFVALEALAAGTTLLASDAGGLKEVVNDGETGFLFAAGDQEDCLAKLEHVYHNRDKELIDRAKVEQDINNRFSYKVYKEKFFRHLFYDTNS
ncbi:glycosyltransferase [Pontibacter ummariensis]|uniref:glycosyltransferase n=1 Tax=Pontibacter ummariensis TaxID=1610492 RepID=UPI0015C64979|nr:glycosyltransferase [Pontibacter ummariensis]